MQFYCLPNKYKKLSCSTAPLCKERKSMGKLLLPQRINFFMAVYSQTPQKWRKLLEMLSGTKIMTWMLMWKINKFIYKNVKHANLYPIVVLLTYSINYRARISWISSEEEGGKSFSTRVNYHLYKIKIITPNQQNKWEFLSDTWRLWSTRSVFNEEN